MKLDIYLHFKGNAREVLDFYGKVFNTRADQMFTYGDAPADPDHPIPEGYADKIMHTSIDIAGVKVMFADVHPGIELTVGSNVALVANAKDAEEAKRIFNSLNKEATVLVPLAKSYFNEAYGMLIDKYGIHWTIGVEL